jgi:hypothetical protein
MSTAQANTRIGPDDPDRAVIDKRLHKRFTVRPDYVRLASTTDQIVSAVEETVGEGTRLVVTGEECFPGWGV